MEKINSQQFLQAKKKNNIYFWLLWLVCFVVFGIQILQKKHTFQFPGTLINMTLLLACSILLIKYQYPSPFPKHETTKGKNNYKLVVTSLLVLLVLILSKVYLGSSLLFGLPVIGGIFALKNKSFVTKREVGYVVVLSIIAAICGLGAGWISMNRVVWSILQLFLVSLGLLAGWSILKSTDLSTYSLGKAAYLSAGFTAALKSFGVGLALCLPWALGNILFGASASWVQHWWQPIIALNPGIAEEAWSRVLLIPVVYCLLRRFGQTRQAFVLSTVIVGFWFSFLHMSGGLINFVLMTPFTTIIFALTLTSLVFYKDLETAIGFHFGIDFVKFLAGFLMNSGVWF